MVWGISGRTVRSNVRGYVWISMQDYNLQVTTCSGNDLCHTDTHTFDQM